MHKTLTYAESLMTQKPEKVEIVDLEARATTDKREISACRTLCQSTAAVVDFVD